MNAIPKREYQEVVTDLVGIWKQEQKEEARLESGRGHSPGIRSAIRDQVRSLCADEEHLLTFYAFPAVMLRYIRSTTAIESL